MPTRWGNSRSPAYGTLSDYQFMRRHTSSDKRKDAARAAWGTALASEADVVDVFVAYCKVGCGCGGMRAVACVGGVRRRMCALWLAFVACVCCGQQCAMIWGAHPAAECHVSVGDAPRKEGS